MKKKKKKTKDQLYEKKLKKEKSKAKKKDANLGRPRRIETFDMIAISQTSRERLNETIHPAALGLVLTLWVHCLLTFGSAKHLLT